MAPSIVVAIGYAVTPYLLTLVMNKMSMSIAYALWAALGIILVVMVGAFYYKKPFDITAIIGTTFIAAGIVIINLWSSAVK